MNKFKKYFLLLPTVIVTACGTSVDYLVPGNKYNSPVFTENYYTHWDAELKNARKVEKKEMTDKSLTKFSDLDQIDPNVATGIIHYSTANEYGADYKMNSVDDSFNYGYQSKLFDGQMVCGAQNYHPEWAYQLGRIQTNESGFSVRFAKESDELHYFAMQFKASTNNQIDCYPVGSDDISYASDPDHDGKIRHNSEVQLTVTIYVKTNKGIVGHPYRSLIKFDENNTNNGSYYVFYAFSLEDENLSRAVGVSFAFTVDDKLINYNHEKGIDNIDYALFLYEMFLPYTYWH